MQIALLSSDMSVDGSSLDQHNFILLEVLVSWYRISWSHIFSRQHQMLRAIARSDLQDEPAEVSLSRLGAPGPLLALIFLQQERLCGGVGRGPRTRWG